MKSQGLIITTLTPLAIVGCAGETIEVQYDKSAPRPNIVILFADDLGYSDLGCYGGEIKTPYLDRLASQGVRFTQFMNCSKSAPSRASLLTGLNAIEAGCSGAPEQMINGVTIAELLQQADYKTLMTGKWHAKETPVRRGFDNFFGVTSGSFNYFPPMKNFWEDDERIDPVNDNNRDYFYTTDAFTSRALKYLDDYCRSETEDPFLLYVAYNAPHYPLQIWEHLTSSYRGRYFKGWDVVREERFARQKEMGIVPEDAVLSPRDESTVPWTEYKKKDAADRTMAAYAAMVTRMDYNIGRILGRIDRMGAANNTIVIFMSDNGGNAEGEMWDGIDQLNRPGITASQARLGDEWANVTNTPFKKFKRYMYNGGIVTPCIIRYPEVTKGSKGAILHTPAQITDIYPTLMELAGVTYPEGETWRVDTKGDKSLKTEWQIEPLSGESIMPILRGEPRDEERLYMNYFQGGRMIMRGDWKMVSDGGDGTVQHLYDYPWELYNMKNDVGECNDLSAEYPELVAELDALYREWIDRAEVVGGVIEHPWYVERFTDEEQRISDEILRDPWIVAQLERREAIGGDIAAELQRVSAQDKSVKLAKGLGMERYPMSYFGVVSNGAKYRKRSEKLKELYNLWDENVAASADYCQTLGEGYREVWEMQERVRPMIPLSDMK